MAKPLTQKAHLVLSMVQFLLHLIHNSWNVGKDVMISSKCRCSTSSIRNSAQVVCMLILHMQFKKISKFVSHNQMLCSYIIAKLWSSISNKSTWVSPPIPLVSNLFGLDMILMYHMNYVFMVLTSSFLNVMSVIVLWNFSRGSKINYLAFVDKYYSLIPSHLLEKYPILLSRSNPNNILIWSSSLHWISSSSI